MRAPDKYRQVWPDTVATIEKPPGPLWRAVKIGAYVINVATVAAVIYLITVLLFSL